MAKFKVGDMVKGTSERYAWTSTNMYKAEVIDVEPNGYIMVKILEHKNSMAIGNKYEGLDPNCFELCEKPKNWGYGEEEEDDEESCSPWMEKSEHKSPLQFKDSKEKGKSKEIDYEKLPSLLELNALNGLENVKRTVTEIVAHVRTSRLRKKAGLKNDPQSLHMVFKGSAGTGKTTVARIVGKLMVELGALKKREDGEVPFVELDPSDLKSKYVGAAEKEVMAKFDEAEGGILFIDEAYSLTMGEGESNQGKSVVSTLVKQMEDRRDRVIVIVAGYDEDMENFLDKNSGLRSRFTNVVSFEDYSMEELVNIANHFCKEKDYTIEVDFLTKLKHCLSIEKKLKAFGNARTVRNIVEKAIRSQSNRIFKIAEPTKEQLMGLTKDDLVYDEDYTLKLLQREQEEKDKRDKKGMMEDMFKAMKEAASSK